MLEKIDESTLQELKDKVAVMEEQIRSKRTEPLEAKTLFAWRSPTHVYIQRNRRWYTQTALVVILIMLILFVFSQFILMAALLALTFVAYVSASVKPEEVEHRITNLGIESLGHKYHWDELNEFWFSTRHNHELLNIDTNLKFPRRLTILISEKDKVRFKKTLVDYLPFHEKPKEDFLDQISNKFTSLVTPSK